MSAPIESAVYKITSAHRDINLVISLEKGFPRGNLIVEKPKEPLPAPYQQWAVVNQSEGIYTFKSLAGDSPGSKKPYARNVETEELEALDPYIRGGSLDVFTTYRIEHASPNKPEVFRIRLPGREKAWTIVDDSTNIILDGYDPKAPANEKQLWRFERIENLR